MIHDGFGNEISESELVANYRKWSHAVAGTMVNASSSLYDDLVQESMIEVWKIGLKKPEGVSATYVTKSARYRMLQVVTGKPMTGGDSTPGPKSRPKELILDWQDVAGHEEDWGLEGLLAASDVLSAVDLAYHQGQILQCLNSLPEQDRRYVYQRFWEGKTDTEIAAEGGLSNKALGTRWTRNIKPRLVEALAHLIDA